MEVHHHPEVEKKGFKEYLLEGLMIFIAVMMGFFAESLRESIADSSKEKEYIISMIQDAKTDTANIQQALKLNDKRLWALDSAASLCFSYNGSGSTDSVMYRQFRKCIVHPNFANLTERTLSQLNNAGGMRLIRKKAAVDSIVSYEDFSKRLIFQQDAYSSYLAGMAELSIKLFNYKYFITYRKPGAPYKPAVYASAKLINRDKAVIIEMANRTKLYAGVVDYYIIRLNETNAHAVNLIKTLRKAYNLEDE
jgi:hypothetical protein